MTTPRTSDLIARQLAQIAAGLDELDAAVAASEPVVWLEPATTFRGGAFGESPADRDAPPPEADER